MVEDANDLPYKLKQKYTEIYAEIREITNGTRSRDAPKRQGALSPKLRKLIALGSAIATQHGRDVIVSCVADCLEAGATRQEIM